MQTENQTAQSLKFSEAVETVVLRIASRLLYVAYCMLLVAVVGSFGLGVWVTEINSKVGGVKAEIVRVHTAINDLKDNIPEDREDVRRLQSKVDRLEGAVFWGKGMPPLKNKTQ